MSDERERDIEPFEAPPGGWEGLQEWATWASRGAGPLTHPQLVAAIRDALAHIECGEPLAAHECLENLLRAIGERGGVAPPLYGRVGTRAPRRR